METPSGPAVRAARAFNAYVAERPQALSQVRSACPVLVNALTLEEPRLLAGHVRWAGSVAASRGDAENDAAALLHRLGSIAEELADVDDRRTVEEFLAAARPAPDAGDDIARYPDARRYLQVLLSFDQESAGALTAAALEDGMPLERIHAEILEPALVEIGRLWETACITVSHEHYASQVTCQIMNVLNATVPRPVQLQRTFVGMCVEGEQHDIGLRMICDQLRARGWRTVYLGADVPTREFAAVLRDTAPDVVGLSLASAARLGDAREAIATARKACPRARIAIGGRIFRDGGNLWNKLGADAGARNAGEAIAAIEALAAR